MSAHTTEENDSMKIELTKLEARLESVRESFETRMTTQDAVLSEIKSAIKDMRAKPTNWIQIVGLGGVLMVVFGAYAYPMRRDLDDLRKSIESQKELVQKDLSLVRSDFDAVKRENIWNWDGMKTRLDNLSKQLDRVWVKTFGDSGERR